MLVLIARKNMAKFKKQKGLVLLALVIVIVLAVASYTFSNISLSTIKAERDKHTQQSLRKAKQALISYAVNYPEITAAIRGPGYLPCPDLLNIGTSSPNNCKTAGVPNVGRLPWVTLNVGDLRDGANERLWYAVSVNFDYSNSPTFNKVNTATIGTLTIRDKQNNILNNGMSNDAAVAIIIAPGMTLTRDDNVVQDRTDENNAINFLDVDTNGEDNASFQHGTLDGFIEGEIINPLGEVVVNDQIVIITYGEIMDAIHNRVSREISNLIGSYFTACVAYPEASTFDPEKATFDSPGLAPPVGGELREGHLPLDSAEPTDWNTGCANGITPQAWLRAESWQAETFYKFAYRNPPPANGLTCGNGANPSCMTVNDGANPPVLNAEALIIFSGRDITGNRPSGNAADYFEGENNYYNDLNDTFDNAQQEDFILVITP